jgi:excisionase family DNA binding protein
MMLEDRLRQMVAALPDEASVLLPVSVVRGWLDDEGDDPAHDLTVAQVAVQLQRSPSTVREWIRRGALEAYQLGKEYRITRVALAALRERQRKGEMQPDTTVTLAGRSALGAWRKLRRKAEPQGTGCR